MCSRAAGKVLPSLSMSSDPPESGCFDMQAYFRAAPIHQFSCSLHLPRVVTCWSVNSKGVHLGLLSSVQSSTPSRPRSCSQAWLPLPSSLGCSSIVREWGLHFHLSDHCLQEQSNGRTVMSARCFCHSGYDECTGRRPPCGNHLAA